MKPVTLFRIIQMTVLLCALIIGGIFMLHQYHHYQHYKKQEQHLLFLQSTIKVIDKLSDERAYLNILLGQPDTTETTLTELRRRQEATDAAVSQLSRHLSYLAPPSPTLFYRSYEHWRLRIKAMRRFTRTVLNTPPASRSSGDITQLIQMNMHLSQPAETMMTMISDNISQHNSGYLHAIETIKSLVILRNQSGLLGSSLVAAMINQRTLTPQETETFYQIKNYVHQLYHRLNYHLDWLNNNDLIPYTSLKKAMDKKYQQLTLPVFDYIFSVGQQKGHYQITSKMLTEQYASQLDSAKRLRYSLLQERINSTDGHQQQAFTFLMITILTVVSVTSGIYYCFKLLAQHLLYPLLEASVLVSLPDEQLYKRTLLPVYKQRNMASRMLIELHTLRMKHRTTQQNNSAESG